MAASRRSHRITDRYRERLIGLAERVEREARAGWRSVSLDALDDTFAAWVDRTALVTKVAQTDAVRLSGAYLTAYLSSELGRRVVGPVPDSRTYAGLSRDGRPLVDPLSKTVITVKLALGEGKSASDALAAGLNRAVRNLDLDVMQAGRFALAEAMEADDRVEGWQRSVRGTCGACMGDIAVKVKVNLPSVPLGVHPNCRCVTVPVVTGTRDLFPLPTGAELFGRMTDSEQDDQFGSEKAALLRSGEVALADLVGTSHLENEADFITERPLSDVHP